MSGSCWSEEEKFRVVVRVVLGILVCVWMRLGEKCFIVCVSVKLLVIKLLCFMLSLVLKNSGMLSV